VLFLSLRAAAGRVGIGKTRAAWCFKEMQEKGFITISKRGVFNMKSISRRGDATAWLQTEFRRGDGSRQQRLHALATGGAGR